MDLNNVIFSLPFFVAIKKIVQNSRVYNGRINGYVLCIVSFSVVHPTMHH